MIISKRVQDILDNMGFKSCNYIIIDSVVFKKKGISYDFVIFDELNANPENNSAEARHLRNNGEPWKRKNKRRF